MSGVEQRGGGGEETLGPTQPNPSTAASPPHVAQQRPHRLVARSPALPVNGGLSSTQNASERVGNPVPTSFSNAPAPARAKKTTETRPRATSAPNNGDATSAHAPPPYAQNESEEAGISAPTVLGARPPTRAGKTTTETWSRAPMTANDGSDASAYAPPPSSLDGGPSPAQNESERAGNFVPTTLGASPPTRVFQTPTETWPRAPPTASARRRDGAKRQTTSPFRFRPLPSWAVVSGQRALVRDFGCSGRECAKKQGVVPFFFFSLASSPPSPRPPPELIVVSLSVAGRLASVPPPRKTFADPRFLCFGMVSSIAKEYFLMSDRGSTSDGTSSLR